MSDYNQLLAALTQAGVKVQPGPNNSTVVVLPTPAGMMRADRHQALLEFLERIDLRAEWDAVKGWSLESPSYRERVEHRKRGDEAVAELARLGYLYNHREQKWLGPPPVAAGDYAHAVPKDEFAALVAAKNRLLTDGYRWENGKWKEPVNFNGPYNTAENDKNRQQLVDFFRTHLGGEFGRYGDSMQWCPEVTAVHFLTQWAQVKGAMFVKGVGFRKVANDNGYDIEMPSAFRTHVVCNIDAGDFADGAKAAFDCVNGVVETMRYDGKHDAREWSTKDIADHFSVKLDPVTGYIVGCGTPTINTDRFKVAQPGTRVNLGASSVMQPWSVSALVEENKVMLAMNGIPTGEAEYTALTHHLLEALVAAIVAPPAKA